MERSAASRTRADYRVSDATMRHAGDVTATERWKYGCRHGVPSGRSMTSDDIFAIATYTDCHDRNRDGEISGGVNPQTEQEGFHAKILLARYVHIRISRKIDDPDMFSSRTHQDAIFLGLIAPFIRDKNRSPAKDTETPFQKKPAILVCISILRIYEIIQTFSKYAKGII